MIYLLPVMVHGWLRRHPRGPKKYMIYMILPLWKLRARFRIRKAGLSPPQPYPSNSLPIFPRRYFHVNVLRSLTLRKHAYSSILKILPTKKWEFSDKNSDIFHISTQNIDCGYSLEPPHRGGSNEYPQSMFLSRNKKNNVYPCKPQFYYI